MTRKDAALLFPNDFLMVMRLFRLIEGLHTCRRHNDDESVEQFSDEENVIPTTKTIAPNKPIPPKSSTPYIYHQGQMDNP